MNKLQEIESRLWDYIDGQSSAEEKQLVEKYIAEDAFWREQYTALLELHQMIRSEELDQPSMRFTKNVMEEISKLQIAPATKFYINKKIVWAIGGFFIVTISAVLTYAFTQTGFSASQPSRSLLQEELMQFDYTGLATSPVLKIFIMLNIILGLLLMDRYISSKRKQIHR